MKRINNDSNEKLMFEPKSGLMYETSVCINHGLNLPEDKFLWSMGLYTDGFLETNKGHKIEAARRKLGSYQIHLGTTSEYTGISKEPICVFPDIELNPEIDIPKNFFLPYFNCHGHTFAENEFWINPMCYQMNNGNIISISENIRILLEDEFIEVDIQENWSVAILLNSNNDITHSVKRENGVLSSKYDGYKLEFYDHISQVETNRYNGGIFKFYRNLE